MSESHGMIDDDPFDAELEDEEELSHGELEDQADEDEFATSN
jgi:hypothetical protein